MCPQVRGSMLTLRPPGTVRLTEDDVLSNGISAAPRTRLVHLLQALRAPLAPLAPRAPLAPAALLACVALAACTAPQSATFLEPLRAPKPLAPPAAAETPAETAETPATPAETPAAPADQRFVRTPSIAPPQTVVETDIFRLGEDLEGPPIGASFNDAPIPSFINEVFAERLGLSFHIAPALREKTDLVTLRLAEPVPPSQLFEAARQALRHYGVDIVEEEGVLTFVISEDIESRDVPLLISGRTLPDVPPSHRDIFQLVPVHVMNPNQLSMLLNQALPAQGLRIIPDPPRNTLMLRGSRALVAHALTLIEALDQPLMRGRHGIIIEPDHIEPQALADDLANMLKAEGYRVDSNIGQLSAGILILPLTSIDKIVAFAASPGVLKRIEAWAAALDQRQQEAIEDAWFTYRVRRTEAASLVETLNRMVSAGAGSPAAQSAAADQTAAPGSSTATRGRIVVDEKRNMLLFKGSGREWTQLRTVIDELDTPVPMVLIEVLIAEVSLTDQDGSGIEFLARAAWDDRFGVRFGTLDALGVQAKALSATIDSAGNTRALLNLFYEDSRVVIRSRPKLTVSSGESAEFQGGNEIPTVTQIADSGTQDAGSTNYVQQVTYRQTGVTLTVEPTVQGDGFVDLTITQELSEAQPTASTSLTGTPSILNRRLVTTVTLRDGGSLVIGGLISDNRSTGQVGVPGVARIPVLGRLFRTDTAQRDRTELIVMVIPYVISDHEEAGELTDRIKAELELHGRYAQ